MGDVIWWTSVCGNSSIRDAFWSHQFTINTTNPDFTNCFQNTILVWTSPIILAISALFYIPFLTSKSNAYTWRDYSRFNITKCLICLLQAAISVVRFGYSVKWLHQGTVVAQVLSPFAVLISLVLAIFLIRYEYVKGIGSSGVIFWYFWVMLICDTFQFRSIIIQAQEKGSVEDMLLCVTFYSAYALLLVQCIMHLWADQRALDGGLYRDLVDLELYDEDDDPDHIAKVSKVYNMRTEKFPCPQLRASFFSRITWYWCTGFLWFGYNVPLTDNTVWDIRPYDRVKPLIGTFYNAWIHSSSNAKDNQHGTVGNYQKNILHSGSGKTEKRRDIISEKTPLLSSKAKRTSAKVDTNDPTNTWRTNSSIVKALWKTFGAYYSAIALYEIVNIVLTFARPVILNALISFVEEEGRFGWQGYVLAVAMFAVSMVRQFNNQLHFYGKVLTAQRIRSTVAAASYRKAMVLSNTVRKDYSVGEIVNFMSVDAQRLLEVTFYFHHFWSAPVQIIIALYMLWGYLGIATLAGFAAMLFLMICNGILASKVKKYQVIQMRLKDTRTKMLNEILNGIKVLKLYAWEGAYEKQVEDVRNEEVDTMKKSAYLLGGTEVSMVGSPLIFMVVAFAVYNLAGIGEFTASVAFVSLTLVNNLSQPLTVLPNGIANLVMAWVSIKRLDRFLNAEELDPDCIQENVEDPTSAVEVVDGTFSWDPDNKPALENINMKIKKGTFVAIVGQVGSGKTSIVNALLGELYKNSGRVGIKGSVAYVPQESWIRNDTVEMNILFGRKKHDKYYQKVIENCALAPDLEQLPGGDQTEIGEKGINLSGGQKQRVSLARAVYQDRDIYLLDDPLSAVDVHVGKHLFEKVIGPTGILRKKTRVLVTHALTYLPSADLIICMQDGKISEIGTYEDLLSNSAVFAELIKTYLAEEVSEEEVDEERQKVKSDMKSRFSHLSDGSESVLSAPTNTSRRRKRRLTERSAISKQPSQMAESKIAEQKIQEGQRLIDAERAETGGVNLSVAWQYTKSLGVWSLIWLLIAYFLQVGTDLAANIWLSEWSEDSSNPTPSMDSGVRLGVYGGIGLGQTLAILIQVFSLATACATASSLLHKNFLKCIVRCPMSFFDTTPVGRILNRFSYDMNTVDNILRFNFTHAIRGTAVSMTTVIAICYTTPIFIAVMIPLFVSYYYIRKFYIISSNQLVRMVSMRASPIYANFGESIMGAVSIRAYQAQKRFTLVNDHLVDGMQKPLFANMVINRWLTVGLDTLGSLVVFFSAIYAVVSKDVITGGLVGLAISYSLQVTDRLATFVKMTSGLENNIVSVERILEYSQLETEADWDIEETKPSIEWPDEGIIKMDSYSTRYREGLDLILKGMNLHISPQEKIGIVGRTGAGKSSMMLALFRIIEPSEGKIVIDGTDISIIGLHDLRSRLTIIPQDPVLFSGSLRMNLDPFEKYSDAEVWEALEHAHLKSYVSSLPERLEHYCTEGGSNLSVGQKQLVCLARALLRKTKILVLDEATAAVDLETDDLIQATIRSEFKECTVLTIAHRISTVMDYDRILVLDSGQIKELDSPTNLLQNQQSVFCAMAKQANIHEDSTTIKIKDKSV